MKESSPYTVSGDVKSGYEKLKPLLLSTLPDQPGVGAALAVYHQGRQVANIYAGEMNAGQPWRDDTLALSFSTGKGVLATLVHRLAEQDYLELDVPIAYYWPEFAQKGKQNITLRDVLSHESGLFDIRHVIQSAAVMLDWEAMLSAYEQATPRFMPGTSVAYQALSMGWIIGGVIEKVMKESFQTTFFRELTQPLGISQDAYFGTPESELHRVARIQKRDRNVRLSPTQPSVLPPGGYRPLTFTEKLLELSGMDPYEAEDAIRPRGMGRMNFYSDAVLGAVIPSANGVFTADALAKHYAMLANRGIYEDRAFLSPATFARLQKIQNTRRDRVMPVPMHWRLGYHRIFTVGKKAGNAFGHNGYNGSFAWADPSRHLAVAYVHNIPNFSFTDLKHLWINQRVLQIFDRANRGWGGWF